MRYKNSSIYVQRQIDEILRLYRFFFRAYVDDVIIFFRFLEEHLRHLSQIFKLFQNRNIILKLFKTFLSYFIIVLLRQKVSSLRMTVSVEKLKIISKIEFSKTLKQLKIYLSKTD